MSNVKLSLIATTDGTRTRKIHRLLSSIITLKSQVEFILVNQSNVNYDYLKNDYQEIDVIIVNKKKMSLSNARNLAISLSSGNVFTFCDDDAYYDPVVLKNIINCGYKKTVIITKVLTNEHKPYGNRSFPDRNQYLDCKGILSFGLSVGCFVFTGNNNKYLPNFDNRFGVGAPFGASEETDLLLRYLKSEVIVKYVESYYVYHDNDFDVVNDTKKFETYGYGFTKVCLKHFDSFALHLMQVWFFVIFKSTLGMVFSKNKSLYFYRVKGMLNGLL